MKRKATVGSNMSCVPTGLCDSPTKSNSNFEVMLTSFEASPITLLSDMCYIRFRGNDTFLLSSEQSL